MRRARCFFVSLLLLFLLINEGGIVVSAFNTGFFVEPLPEHNMDMLRKNINIRMLSDEPEKRPIDHFAVNADGKIAIVCSDFESKTICVYTSAGDFQYGYSFQCDGTVGVEWNENNINIYLARSSVIFSVSPNGVILDIFKVPDSTDNNTYTNHFIYSNERTIENTVYTLKNDQGVFNLFASSYSQLAVKNAGEEEKIIYDVSSTQFSKALIVFIGSFVFICIVATGVIWQFIKLNRR